MMPIVTETETEPMIASERRLGRPAGQRPDQDRAAPAREDAHAAAEHAEHDRLDQELAEDVARAGADGHPQADLAVRSVTDTSMMFMIPTPPTTSEISATHSSSPATSADRRLHGAG